MDIEIKGKKILLIGNGFDLEHVVLLSYLKFRDCLGKCSVLKQLLEIYIK